MQGKPIIIAELNKLLAGELSAIDQYFIHSRMYQDWGYSKLFERISHESDEEKQHASWIIERILFLEGIPEMRTTYPEFSQFKELPAWGIFIRHADDIRLDNVKLKSLPHTQMQNIVR